MGGRQAGRQAGKLMVISLGALPGPESGDYTSISLFIAPIIVSVGFYMYSDSLPCFLCKYYNL